MGLKNYIKNFIRSSRFIRKKIFNLNLKYFGKRIYLEDSLTSPVVSLNNFIENNYKKNFISILDIGCFGEIPQHLKGLKKFYFHGVDIDKEEIKRQKNFYKGSNFNFYNYKVIEPDNLENIRKNFIDENIDQNLYTIEEVQAYNHKIDDQNLNKNQNLTNKNFTNQKITIDNAYQNLIYPNEINFLKIYIDANDHEVLYGAENLLNKDKLFGVKIEVDYVKAKGRKFRNFIEVLRYMTHKKFNLYNFISNKYSSDLLPTRYIYSFPGPNNNGSPLSGDLVFFKNFDDKFLSKLNHDDNLKILRLLEIYNQDHIAIELINKIKNFTEDEKNKFKFDLIKKYSLHFFDEILDYKEYYERYTKNKNKFFNII